MARTPLRIVGACCGAAWWAISIVAGANSYGILGSYPIIGLPAGAITGIAITALSTPFYRLPSRALLWYSPLSVYVAIAIYGAILFVIRWVMNDFRPDQIPWAVGVESVLGMWWGMTFAWPVGIPVHLIAYTNHKLLRKLSSPPASEIAPPSWDPAS